MNKFWAIAMAILTLAACVKEAPVSGKRLFAQNCTVCHGAKGYGDGPFAQNLIIPPADLTVLSANNRGDFPRDYVVSTMDGFARGKHFSGAMPEFGVKLAGEPVMMPTGGGVLTPTPKALVALADYLESIQDK